jgi:hypothetical protein
MPECTASFVSGFAHPLHGADHVVAMLAVGIWGALAGGRAIRVWPIAFVATMLVGLPVLRRALRFHSWSLRFCHRLSSSAFSSRSPRRLHSGWAQRSSDCSRSFTATPTEPRPYRGARSPTQRDSCSRRVRFTQPASVSAVSPAARCRESRCARLALWPRVAAWPRWSR